SRDWSSDVCSSDLHVVAHAPHLVRAAEARGCALHGLEILGHERRHDLLDRHQVVPHVLLLVEGHHGQEGNRAALVHAIEGLGRGGGFGRRRRSGAGGEGDGGKKKEQVDPHESFSVRGGSQGSRKVSASFHMGSSTSVSPWSESSSTSRTVGERETNFREAPTGTSASWMPWRISPGHSTLG